MRIQIVARHAAVPDDVVERVHELLPKLQRFDPNLSHAEVIFTEERHIKKAEGILYLDHEEPAVAEGEGIDFRAALDQMSDRTGKILRRRRRQEKDHQGPGLADLALAEE
jgi:ribosome-associated translation inhibitor RaiA